MTAVDSNEEVLRLALLDSNDEILSLTLLDRNSQHRDREPADIKANSETTKHGEFTNSRACQQEEPADRLQYIRGPSFQPWKP